LSTDTAETNPPAAEMDMGALLDSEASQPGNLRRGEIVEGMVMGASPDGLIVDVGTKTEAVIPQGEMLSLGVEGAARLKAGDTVRVMVLQPSSSEGHAIVSLDRARGEEGWDTLAARYESGETFDAQVTGHNRGGILVNVEGVAAFVPLSQLVGLRPERSDTGAGLAHAVGKALRLKVIELNRRRNRVILSERGALQEWRSQQKDRLLSELEEGEIRKGRVSSIRNFGVFVDLGGADGLVHLSEISWDRTKAPEELFKIGDEVDVYVMKIDAEKKKIALSIRRAQPAHWDGIVDKYQVGDVVPGIVTKLATFGAFARIEGPVEPAQVRVRVPEVVPRDLVVRLEGHGPLVRVDGLLVPAEAVEGHPLVVPHDVVLVPEGDRAVVVGQGVRVAPRVAEGVPFEEFRLAGCEVAGARGARHSARPSGVAGIKVPRSRSGVRASRSGGLIFK